MEQDDVKALKRIMSLAVIKDDPEDTAFDNLHKIGDIVSEMLYRYDAEWKRLQDEQWIRANNWRKEEAEHRAELLAEGVELKPNIPDDNCPKSSCPIMFGQNYVVCTQCGRNPVPKRNRFE